MNHHQNLDLGRQPCSALPPVSPQLFQQNFPQYFQQGPFTAQQQPWPRHGFINNQQYQNYPIPPPPPGFFRLQHHQNRSPYSVPNNAMYSQSYAPPRPLHPLRLPPLSSNESLQSINGNSNFGFSSRNYGNLNRDRNGRESPAGLNPGKPNGLDARINETSETLLPESGKTAQGGLLIYIDNSNIWINTMEKSAKSLGFREKINHDPRTRLNFSKLLTLASDGRPIIRAVLYGSEPPPVAKFWEGVKGCGLCEVDVQVTRRSTYSNREREVDQNIMLDIGVDIVIHQNQANHGGGIIVFTGDGGMISAVRRALAYNWNVEIWSYRNSIAREYEEESLINSKLTIKYLDDCFEDKGIVFHTLEWKIQIPRERSLVLTFRRVHDERKAAVLETCVKAFTELVQMPMAGKYLRDNDGEASRYTHLAVVCCVGKLVLKEDVRSDIFYKFETDTNVETRSKKGYPNFHFTDQQWDHIPKIVGLEFLKDEYFTKHAKAEVEALVQEAVKSSNNYYDNPKYDFNSEVYKRVEHVISPELRLKAIQDSRISDDLKIEMESIIQKDKPIIRSLPLFLQDMRIDASLVEVEAPANEDDGEGGYTVQAMRKPKRRFQKYSEECKYSFRCNKGFKCLYNHSDKEKEFFKVQPNSEIRTTYKRKDCDHYQNGTCKYNGIMSYMCPFSHGLWCRICKVDADAGHIQEKCLASPRRPDGLVH